MPLTRENAKLNSKILNQSVAVYDNEFDCNDIECRNYMFQRHNYLIWFI